MRASKGNWWERQLSIGYQSPTTSGVPGGSVRTTCRDAPSLNRQWSDNGPHPKLQSSHTHGRRRSMSRHQLFEASSHFIQFFSLWQQIRWIRDYLGTNNSRRDVTNLSLILFITTTSGSVIGSSSRKKTHFCCLGTELAAKMIQWDIRAMWIGFQISIERTHCWADDGAIRLVTDWDYTSVSSTQR